MTLRGRIATSWLAATFCGALALAGLPGLSSDETLTLEAGRQGAGLVVRAPSDPRTAFRGLGALSAERQRPLTAELLHGFAAEGGERVGLGPVRGARLGAVTVTALLAALLALAGFELGGAACAVLTPAVLFASPRLLSQGLVAAPDLLGALLWLAAVLAFARSLEAPTRLARTHAGIWTGLFVGLGASARPDLWTLLPLFLFHWLLGRLHLWRLSRAAPSPLEELPPEPREDWGARLRRIPTGVAAAATLGPALAWATWPWLWSDPLHRALPALRSAHGLGASLTVNPAVLAAAALPVPLVLLGLLGLGHALFRVQRAVRRGDGHEARLEALLVLAAGVPLVLGAAGLAPRRPGLGPVLQALPVLALLGARALGSLSRLAWPSRRDGLQAALAMLLLYPGLRAAVLTFPLGTSAYGETVGGAPGAAGRGWPRQDGGEAARAVLPALGQHLVPGARVLWIGVEPGAVARYRRAGLIRADLADAPDAATADAAVVARDTGPRDQEFDAWRALGSARAEAGAYLDEVPLAQVFARPGAWR